MALFDAAPMDPIGAPMPVGVGGGAAPVDVCQHAGRKLTAYEWDEYLGTDEPYRTTCPQWPAGV